MPNRDSNETTVDDSFSVTIPVSIRRETDIEPGDRLLWSVEDDDTLSVEVISQRYGAFSELDPVDVGEETDAADDHDKAVGDN